MAGYISALVLVILPALAIAACPAAMMAAPAGAIPMPPDVPAYNGYPGLPGVAAIFSLPFTAGTLIDGFQWIVLMGLGFLGLAFVTIALIASGDRRTCAKPRMQPSAGMEARISQLEAELRARTEELEAAEEAADLYLDTISHDIGNQNHIAMGYLELASMRLPTGSEERELVEKPRDALEASTRFIRCLQSIQLARTGKLELKAVDLDTVLASLAHKIAQEHCATLRYSRQPGSLALGNELLPEAFCSVVYAVMWFSTAPAMIEIRLSGYAEAGKSYYRVTVESDGHGLPEELKGRLFAPRQAGQPTGGLRGPGLYLARMAIEACDGKILAEDRIYGGLCKGCRFVVLLPAIGATGEAPGTGSSAAGT